MSYILDALKKSQEERELGRVPTLASASSLKWDKPSKLNPWSVAALVLAGIAVLIALYAAFALRPSAPFAASDAAAPKAAEPAEEVASAEPPKGGSGPEVAQSEPETADPSAEDEAPVLDERAMLEQVERYEQEQGPLAERQASAKPAPASVFAPGPGTPTAGGGVPPDVRDEILEFKRQALREKAKQARAAPKPVPVPSMRQEPPVPEPRPEPAAREGAPAGADLAAAPRLPPEIAAKAPPARVTVHVYSEEPAKRFVILNSTRATEGERLTDGLVVEEIRADGVVLSFEGHRFFRAR